MRQDGPTTVATSPVQRSWLDYLALGVGSLAVSHFAWLVWATDLIEDSWRALAKLLVLVPAIVLFLITMLVARRCHASGNRLGSILVSILALIGIANPLGVILRGLRILLMVLLAD